MNPYRTTNKKTSKIRSLLQIIKIFARRIFNIRYGVISFMKKIFKNIFKFVWNPFSFILCLLIFAGSVMAYGISSSRKVYAAKIQYGTEMCAEQGFKYVGYKQIDDSTYIELMCIDQNHDSHTKYVDNYGYRKYMPK